jgi:hypothetical protein
MHLGSIAQFQGLKAMRFFPPHETASYCYCRRCYLDFMVKDSGQDAHWGAQGRLMHWLYRLGEEP